MSVEPTPAGTAVPSAWFHCKFMPFNRTIQIFSLFFKKIPKKFSQKPLHYTKYVITFFVITLFVGKFALLN